MARDGPEILADDEERDILDFMLNACGLDSRDFHRDERILSRQNLEKNFIFLKKMVDGRSFRRAPYFVIGYLMLITGLRIPDMLKSDILRMIKLEFEKEYRPKDFNILRKICLEDFKEKICFHKSGMVLRPIKLGYINNVELSDAIIGLNQFWYACKTGEIYNIRHLKIDGWGLTQIPPPIFNIKNLESLSLQFNQIKHIPVDIANLASLKYLDLGYNQLTDFPKSVLSLHSMIGLGLDHNFMTNIPKGIIHLKSIEYLDLNNNLISHLPDVLRDLNSLKRLSIRDNNIKEIPNSFKSANFSIFLTY